MGKMDSAPIPAPTGEALIKIKIEERKRQLENLRNDAVRKVAEEVADILVQKKFVSKEILKKIKETEKTIKRDSLEHGQEIEKKGDWQISFAKIEIKKEIISFFIDNQDEKTKNAKELFFSSLPNLNPETIKKALVNFYERNPLADTKGSSKVA